MGRLGISEADVYDVFKKGEGKIIGGTKAAIRKYNGYEIGIFYDTCSRAGDDYTVITVWRRDRR